MCGSIGDEASSCLGFMPIYNGRRGDVDLIGDEIRPLHVSLATDPVVLINVEAIAEFRSAVFIGASQLSLSGCSGRKKRAYCNGGFLCMGL